MNQGTTDKQPSPATAQARAARGGKFLTFVLAGEEYGMEILKVQEIIVMVEITPVPRAPEFILGVINLRGTVIPILDLRIKLDMHTAQVTEQTCIIVVNAAGAKMGLLVDQVSEVLSIPGEQIVEVPPLGMTVNTDYILGIAKAPAGIKILLDLDRLLSTQQVIDIHQAAAGEPQ